jgi:uncharacterized protein (DUF58 family)
MNAPKAFLALILLSFLAFSSGFDLLYRLAYTVALVLILAYLWTKANMNGVLLHRHFRGSRWQVGQILEERFTLENRSILPKIWLQLRDESTLPGHQVSAVINVPGRDTRSWLVRTECNQRGRYTLGPLAIATGDPFGLFHRQALVLETRQVVVYPRVVQLPHLQIPTGDLPGGTISRERSFAATPSAHGIREYVPGDSLNHIHWLSTARSGRLMSKEFEQDPISDVWILLDLESRVQIGKGLDSTEEWAVTVAASLATHFLAQGRAVGLVAHGNERCFVNSDRSTRQQIKILEELAVVRATGRESLASALAIEGAHFSRSDTLLVVTPSTDEWWLDSLRLLMQRGVRCASFLLESSTFGGASSSLLLVSSLAAAQVPTYLVRKGEPLERSIAGEGLKFGVLANPRRKI